MDLNVDTDTSIRAAPRERTALVKAPTTIRSFANVGLVAVETRTGASVRAKVTSILRWSGKN